MDNINEKDKIQIHSCSQGHFFVIKDRCMIGPYASAEIAEKHGRIYFDWVNGKLPKDTEHRCKDCEGDGRKIKIFACHICDV